MPNGTGNIFSAVCLDVLENNVNSLMLPTCRRVPPDKIRAGKKFKTTCNVNGASQKL